MSFASGFNAGINLTAQLRADARARRQEARQADLDERAEARAKVQDEAARLQIDNLRQKLETARRVENEVVLDKAASETALGYWASETGKLDLSTPEGIEEYRKISGWAFGNIKDNDVMQRYLLIDKGNKERGAFREALDLQNAAYKVQLENKQLAIELGNKGHVIDPNTPIGQQRIIEYRNFKSFEAAAGTDIPLADLGVNPNEPFLNNQQLNTAMEKLRGNNQYIAEQKLKGEKQRQKEEARKAISDLGPGAPTEDIIAASGVGRDGDNAQMGELRDTFFALDVVSDIKRDLDYIEWQGPVIGEFVASIKEWTGTGPEISAFRARLIEAVPLLAKGVFRETGVLTDEDINRYAKTVAALDKPEASNQMIIGNTMSLLKRMLRNSLRRMANDGIDVSSFSDDYAMWSEVPVMAYNSPEKDVNSHVRDMTRQIIADMTAEVPKIRPGERVFLWDKERGEWMNREVLPLKHYQDKLKD